MRNRTEWTGFLATMTAKADTTRTGAKIQKNSASACIARLSSKAPRPNPSPFAGEGSTRRPAFLDAPVVARTPRPAGQNAFADNVRLSRAMASILPRKGRRLLSIRRVERDVARQLPLPAIAVGQQSLLVVVKLFARLGREFEIRSFDDRVDRTGFLAHPAVDALDHVDVIASRAPGAVVASRSRLDRDRLGRTDRLAQFAGDAALFAVGIAAERVLAAKARAQRRLFVRIVQRRLRLEHVANRQRERCQEFAEEQRAGGLSEPQSH